MFCDGEKEADLIELFPGPYISARREFLRDPEATERMEEDDLE